MNFHNSDEARAVALRAYASTATLTYASMLTGIPNADIIHGGNFPRLARLRWAVMYGLRHTHKWTLTRIGRFLHLDHSTVSHGIERCEAMLAVDEEYASLVAEICSLGSRR